MSPSWKDIVLDLVDAEFRPRVKAVLDAFDIPERDGLWKLKEGLNLARARAITSKTVLHPSFIHLLGDLAGVAGVINLLCGLPVAFPPRDRGEP